MARRRKKNPLLMRIVVGTIIVHVIALPIAAHFGAFDKLKQRFGDSRVILIPLPKEAKEKEQAKEHKAKTKVAKAPGKSSVKRAGAAKPNPNLQKVVVANEKGDNGNGDAPTITQGTRTDVGEVPTQPTTTTVTKPATTGGDTGTPTTKTTVIPPPPPPPITSKPVEEIKPKHVPLYVEPEQDYCPQPTIPDDLRSETLEKNFVAMFTVGPDGKPTEVKMTQSTGSSELDEVALKTAKQWRFKPATLDGARVESKVELTIEFRVE